MYLGEKSSYIVQFYFLDIIIRIHYLRDKIEIGRLKSSITKFRLSQVIEVYINIRTNTKKYCDASADKEEQTAVDREKVGENSQRNSSYEITYSADHYACRHFHLQNPSTIITLLTVQ